MEAHNQNVPVLLKDNQMELKKCTVCKQIKSLSEYNTRPDRKSGYRSECKKCQYKRQYCREKTQKYRIRAKQKALYATKIKILKKPEKCEKCGLKKPLDRHHPDYKYPKKVEWLCRKCHSNKHYTKTG